MRLYAGMLLVVGLAAMAGDLLGVRGLKGLGAANGASPAPRVFSAVRGLETYSTRFSLAWVDRSGVARTLELTPEVGARIEGPYNRRNVYGAALAYGPILAEDEAGRAMLAQVLAYGLTGDAPLLVELGVDPADVTDLRLVYEPVESSDPRGIATVLAVPLPDGERR